MASIAPPVAWTARRISSWMPSRRVTESKPRPTAPWLVTTTTRAPSRRSAASPTSVPGRNSNSPQLRTWFRRRRLMTPSRSRNTVGRASPWESCSGKESAPHAVRDGVLEDEVAVLDDAIVIAGHVDGALHHRLEGAARETDEGDRPGAVNAGRFHGGEHIRGIAAGADRDHCVPGVEQRVELLGED